MGNVCKLFRFLFSGDKKETEYSPVDPNDIALLLCMKECRFGGEIVLPSGKTLSPPPEGKEWRLRGVKLVLQDKALQ